MSTRFQPGDLVVYKKQKRSSCPGPRAHHIAPAVQDGKFSYVVDKYWVVAAVRNDDTIVVQTRRGKRHQISATDPNLRRTKWWQRLSNRSRYPQLEEVANPKQR